MKLTDLHIAKNTSNQTFSFLKKCLLAIAFAFICSGLAAQHIQQFTQKPTTGFIENKGQIHDQNYLPNPAVKYLLHLGNGLNVQLKANSFSYDTYITERVKSDREMPHSKFMDSSEQYYITYHFHRVDIELIGANPSPEIIAEYPSEDYLNYYNTVTPEEGATFVRNYQKVTYKNIYAGIDLEFEARPGAAKPVEYNFIIHPGANASQIRMKYKGANETSFSDGKIQVEVAHGTFYESIPLSNLKESNEQVEVSYMEYDENVFGFKIPFYDKDQVLIIDPVPRLEWATYYGGSDFEYISEIVCDDSNNINITGASSSNTAIATSGSFQSSLSAYTDAVIIKFNQFGKRLWGTYYGSSKSETSDGLTMDINRYLYIIGRTSSTDVIYTSGAHQTTYGGGNSDGFIAKFTSAGQRIWGTYYGGTSGDNLYSIATDKYGNIYSTGTTQSTSSIASSGAHQTTYGGNSDVFIVKFNSKGQRQWGTYYGGSSFDDGTNIATDISGNLYVSGTTRSTSGVATFGAHQTSYAGGSYDAFIVKFDTSGQRIWGTYYGGSDSDYGYGIKSDNDHSIYIKGWTNSSNNIACSGVHQTSINDSGDIFIAKFDTNGQRQWGTYYGGSNSENDVPGVYTWGIGNDITLNKHGEIYVIGGTSSVSLIATSGAFQFFKNRYLDVFIAKFCSTGQRLWGTYFGGNLMDRPGCIALDSNDNIYIAGYTSSTASIATSGAHQTTYGGGIYDGFIAKIIECEPIFDTISITSCDSFDFNGKMHYNTGVYYDTVTSYSYCDSIITLYLTIHKKATPRFHINENLNCFKNNYFIFTDSSSIDTGYIARYFWHFGDGDYSLSKSPVHSYQTADTFSVSLLLISDQGCRDSLSKTVIVHPTPEPSFYFNDSTQCLTGNNFQLTNTSTISSGSLTYLWEFGDGDTSTALHPAHTYFNPDTFWVNLYATSDQHCADTFRQALIVFPMPQAAFTVDDSAQCFLGNAFAFNDTSLISSGSYTRFWSFGDGDSSTLQSPVHSYQTADTFNISLLLVSDQGCRDSLSKTVIIHPSPEPSFYFNDSNQCLLGNYFQLSNASTLSSGSLTYLWEFGDGDTSTALNPAHTYSNPDTFWVSLYATSNHNCPDTFRQALIVFPMPQAAFSVDDSAQCLRGNLFSFSNHSAISSGTLSYQWDFGDSDSSLIENPTHTYSIFDTLGVRLIATSSEQCPDTAYRFVVIHPMPVADYFLWDTFQCFDGNAFGFSNTSSIPYGNISYLWHFGDGNSSTLKDPVHSFAFADTFDVHLLVTSSNGCQDSIHGFVYVVVHPQPLSAFSIADSAQCLSHNLFEFYNQSIISAGSFSQIWHFGDGDTSSSFDAIHSYSLYDTLNVRLLIISDQFCKDSVEKTVIIHPMPKADFVVDTNSLCFNENIFHFTHKSSIPYGSIDHFLWDFADLHTSTQQNPVHKYAYVDTFPVKLLITSANQCKDSLTKEVMVRPMPVADFTINNSSQCLTNNLFHFSNLSQVKYGTMDFRWDFGDVDSAFIENPNHAYGWFDTFTIRMIASSDYNCKDTFYKIALVHPMPVADFSIADADQCLRNNLFEFSNLSTILHGTLNYLWDFGDMSTSPLENSDHSYLTDDTYSVKFLAISDQNCRDSIEKQVIVWPMPLASFTVNDSTQCFKGNRFEFTNTTSIRYGSLNYQWRIENDTLTPLHLPPRSFKKWGRYPVQLISQSNNGCLDTFNEHLIVYPMPVSAFIFFNNCLEDTMWFFDSSFVDSGIVMQWYWDFKNGKTSSLQNPYTIFNDTGRKSVSLTSTTDFGCSTDTTRYFVIEAHVTAPPLQRATVVDNNYILIEWEKPLAGILKSYTLERSEDGFFWETLSEKDRTARSYEDVNVRVGEKPYSYRLNATDSCDYTGDYSNIGKSIHLSADTTDLFPVLIWTPYEFWVAGVMSYELQVKGWGDFQTLIEIPQSAFPNPQSAISQTDSFYAITGKDYCYRVIAYRTGDSLQSVSNEVCIPTAFRLFVPNAFSPNHDGINDFFMPVGIFIKDYNMQIYNRWGEKIFETDDINTGWDGKFKDDYCPAGVYVYQIVVRTAEGKNKKVTGSVHLLR